jgi:thioredoxin-related protein
MDKKTFTDPELIKYLNENFHVVKFNAEQKETLSFRGQTYNWQSSGRNGVNMLALELLQGRLSYPTLVYLNENLEPIRVSPGYKDA